MPSPDEEGLKGKAEKVGEQVEKVGETVEKVGKEVEKKAEKVQHEVGEIWPFVEDLHLPSIAVGFAGALFVFFVLTFVYKSGKLLVKIGLFVAIVILIAGAYFGWLRSAAGLGKARFSTPQEIVDDAQKAADQMQKRMKETEKTLKKIEEGMK
jgi:hypothetical protein